MNGNGWSFFPWVVPLGLNHALISDSLNLLSVGDDASTYPGFIGKKAETKRASPRSGHSSNIQLLAKLQREDRESHASRFKKLCPKSWRFPRQFKELKVIDDYYQLHWTSCHFIRTFTRIFDREIDSLSQFYTTSVQKGKLRFIWLATKDSLMLNWWWMTNSPI